MSARNSIRRALFTGLVGLTAPLSLIPSALPQAHAGTGCTVVYPLTNCMYGCVVSEQQHVVVTGNDVTGRADCGYGVATCYSGLTSTGCSRSGSRSTFTDVYWNACSVDPGNLATFWIVECTSA